MAAPLALDVLSGVYPARKFKPANNATTHSESVRRISGDFLSGSKWSRSYWSTLVITYGLDVHIGNVIFHHSRYGDNMSTTDTTSEHIIMLTEVMK
jgi:hypothetical protein